MEYIYGCLLSLFQIDSRLKLLATLFFKTNEVSDTSCDDDDDDDDDDDEDDD